ncbi:hypothetical protein [Desulfosporosinus nitroreducens]|uniref:Uncharacterized protein n=1 Tax=Desulfosporosinus nitroreducens TaxID=2018668 RepID=A0ABT8QPT3_9FIRM|nr:hypothetical protein [Desulfosporosinus nitroreducens]MDO0822108.1 hypothetical protein [Desulfosporosinus nitroreducens]
MKLLYQWREEGVREGKTEYINSKGKEYRLSFQTCLNCHYNPGVKTSEQFCVSCHNYAAVNRIVGSVICCRTLIFNNFLLF